jgi:hypothetical protein
MRVFNDIYTLRKLLKFPWYFAQFALSLYNCNRYNRYKKDLDFDKKSHYQSTRLDPLGNRRATNISNDYYQFETPDDKYSTMKVEFLGNKIPYQNINEQQKKKVSKPTRNMDKKLDQSMHF